MSETIETQILYRFEISMQAPNEDRRVIYMLEVLSDRVLTPRQLVANSWDIVEPIGDSVEARQAQLLASIEHAQAVPR